MPTDAMTLRTDPEEITKNVQNEENQGVHHSLIILAKMEKPNIRACV